ncbi:MAG: iron ABC transporter permease [Proteobacteria bacterium]|nr:iron ABC transporter permease [Pseudomonadota bacterium]
MRRRAPLLTAGFLLLIAIAAWVALGLGVDAAGRRYDLDWPRRLLSADDGLRAPLVHLRGPRVAAALLVGAALGVAGLALQGLTRNPLADPYLLGVSGGAGLAVVLLHSVPGLGAALGWAALPLSAFVGALAALALVLTLAQTAGGRLSLVSLLLAGVVVNAFCAALMTLLLTRADPFRLRLTTSWLLGGIGFVDWPQLVACTLLAAVVGVLLRGWAHRLNAFALGTAAAGGVGLDAPRVVREVALLASVLAAVAVAVAGLIGYVGLIVPPLVRRLVGSDFRATLPAAAAGGALLVLVADTVARTALAPEELPVGVLTGLLGCPLLLVQLKRQLRPAR